MKYSLGRHVVLYSTQNMALKSCIFFNIYYFIITFLAPTLSAASVTAIP
jgi:hypothetical protein